MKRYDCGYNDDIPCEDGRFVLYSEAEARIEALEKAVDRVLVKINAVTAPHRHGAPQRKGAMDALCNEQIELEAARAAVEGA